jgi:hypothetical protein
LEAAKPFLLGRGGNAVPLIQRAENPGHVATMDFDKHVLFKEAAEFFNPLILGKS